MSIDQHRTQPYEHENDININIQRACVTSCNKEMRLDGCVRRDVKMRIKGTSCMLYVHKHRDTSSRDGECGHAQYDDEGVHGKHDIEDSADFRTSL